MMCKKMMVGCQKGGVAKTTSTCIIAEIMAEAGYKVLVVDLDTQGNATQMLTGNSIYKYSGQSVMEAIKENNAAHYMVKTKENLYVLPAEDMLATFSRYIYTSGFTEPLKVIANTLKPIENEFDFIFLDCPPNLGDIVLSSVIYTDYIIAPVDSGAFGLDAISRFIDFVESAKAEGHTHAEILGVVMTLKDNRSNHEKNLSKEIRSQYNELIFNSEIRKIAKIKEMALSGVDFKSREHLTALEDYLNLTEEVLNRVEKRNNARTN